jgi:hypothetical protein
MDETWNSERIAIVGSILTRYSAHLEPGDRIQLGMEGDPCTLYRSVDDAPTATVLDVHRESSGAVRFRAQLDGSGAFVDLNNHSVAPGDLWEIAPSFLDAFKERVFKRTHSENAEEPDKVSESGADEKRDDNGAHFSEEFRSSIDSRIASIEDNLERLSIAEREFRSTMTEVVRELAGDLLRAKNGDEALFAKKYADKYDKVANEDDFRGSESNDTNNKQTHQSEKFDFQEHMVTPLSYKTMGNDDDLSEAE